MRAEQVLDLLGCLRDHRIEVYVDGGWAVDALLGRQTRVHDDLDVAIPHAQVKALRRLLGGLNFAEQPRPDSWECNFVLAHPDGRRIDVHSYTLDGDGRNIGGIPYAAENLTGIGHIDGHEVRCIEPASLVRFHTGYEPDANDAHDVFLLCRQFGLALPSEYRERTSPQAGPPSSRAETEARSESK